MWKYDLIMHAADEFRKGAIGSESAGIISLDSDDG